MKDVPQVWVFRLCREHDLAKCKQELFLSQTLIYYLILKYYKQQICSIIQPRKGGMHVQSPTHLSRLCQKVVRRCSRGCSTPATSSQQFLSLCCPFLRYNFTQELLVLTDYSYTSSQKGSQFICAPGCVLSSSQTLPWPRQLGIPQYFTQWLIQVE